MRMKLIRGPALEPVPLADLKSSLGHVDAAEDTLLSCLLTAARIVCEARTGLLFLSQRWAVSGIVHAPGDPIDLPLAPVRAVEAVRLYDDDGTAEALDPGLIGLTGEGHRRHLQLAEGGLGQGASGAHVLEVEVTAGIADRRRDLPDQLQEAVCRLAAHWYSTKEQVGFGDCSVPIPDTVAAQLMPFAPHPTRH